jgi:FkbM family methyltransferase
MKNYNFQTKINRKDIFLTVLKYPVRFFLSKLSNIYLKKYNQIAHYSFEYVGQSIEIDGCYEIKELELVNSWLKRVKPDIFNGTCLDIGANIGNHSIFYSKNFNQVFAFELLPKNLELLKLNCSKFKNIKIFDFGLSDIDDKINFNFDPSNLGATSKLNLHGNNIKNISLPVKKLDDLEFDKSTVSFIKLDVEGSEIDVLNGGSKFLTEFKPVIVFEQHADDFQNNKSPVINLLKEKGYNKFFITKTSPTFLEQDNIISLILTFFISIIFGGKKNIIEKSKFKAKFYPMIIATKNLNF